MLDWVAYVGAAVILFLVPTDFNISSVYFSGSSVPEVTTGNMYYLLFFYMIGFMGGSTIILIRHFFRSSGIERRKIVIILSGVLLTFAFGFVTNLILPVLGLSQWANLGPLFSVFFLIFTAYAITRYRFLDIRLVILRSLTFGLLVLVVTVSFGALSAFFSAVIFKQQSNLRSDMLVGFAVGILITAIYQPTRKFVGKLTEKVLYKRSYSPDKLLKEIGQVLSSVSSLDTLLSLISRQLLDAFQGSRLAVALLDKRGKLTMAYQQGFDGKFVELVTGKEKILPEYFGQKRDVVVLDELWAQYESGEYRPKDVQLLQSLHDLAIGLIVPLFAKDSLIGLLAIGEKKSGDVYTDQDIRTLTVVSGQAAVAIDNARLYDELRELNATLQQRVDTATAELRSANSRLRELDQMKSDFISIASHQLRTPLTITKGYVSMMEEGDFGPVPEKISEQLKKIFIANERLIELVENLLDISRIESGRQEYKFAAAKLDELAHTVVDTLSKNAKDRGLQLTLVPPVQPFPPVVVDENKLHEVMMNFVDNAIKYTKQGSVEVSLVAEPAGMVTFSVKDTGMGIPEETLPHLFEKFSRAKNSSQMHTEGLGLGIYVARMIVDAHQGIIGAESAGPEKGSRFFFSVPLKHTTVPTETHEPIRRFLG